MSLFKRAWYYISRKKTKSILMFLILFLIATALASGSAVMQASSLMKNKINEEINSGFLFKRGGPDDYWFTGENVSNKDADKIAKIDGISHYNYRFTTFLKVSDTKLVDLTNSNIQINPEYEEIYKGVVNVSGNLDSSMDKVFGNTILKLKEGRHIKPEDRNKAMVHEEYAKTNGLTIGSKIKLNNGSFGMGQPIDDEKVDEEEFEIVGIFTGKNETAPQMKLEMLQNHIFTDFYTLQKLNGGELVGATDATYIVKDPSQMESIMAEAKKLAIDWSKHEIVENKSSYAGIISSAKHMEQLINTIVIGIIVISTIILSLILAFWINGRIHETGIMLSIGISKLQIIGQYIVEICIIACLSFGLSYFAGNQIAQSMGNMIVDKANEESKEDLRQSLGGLVMGEDIESAGLNGSLEQMEITLKPKDMLSVFALGGFIIIISVTFASYRVIRMKPREILSKMS